MRLNVPELCNLVIYGAGKYAHELYRYLTYEDEQDRVSFFVVTDSIDQPDSLFDKPVIRFDSIKKELSDSHVYVAVSPKFSQDICNLLKESNARSVEVIPRQFILELDQEINKIKESMLIRNNRIFFDTFWGLGYMCNPKYIAEEIIRQKLDVEMFWDITDDANMEFPEQIIPVKRGSIEYEKAFYSSHIVITNMNTATGFKKKAGQYYINTWHGTGPFKKIGKFVYELKNDTKSYQIMKQNYSDVDLAVAACRQCEINYRQALEYDGILKPWGYPRNDVFFRNSEKIIKRVREKFNIEDDVKLALFAPTFRASIRNKSKTVAEAYNLELGKVKASLEHRFGGKYIVAYRFHQYIYRLIDVGGFYSEGLDVTKYPDMQELLVASDILITDWSSSIWDYSLTLKPIFLYFNDAEEAERDYGFYIRPDDLPYPKGHTTEELCREIESFNEQKYKNNVSEFLKEYKSYDDGHASERVANHIAELIKE
ncbi:CDP-glycerol glycerophosphotransferase family protein [Butyrivibrio sp. WCE2006]|uniref:CDP-glycerol glycerophosphotransferase family protein n=1 Tax=Butyrivibrio sp. WCE2006 TaxID=1410611 RepID=UPI0005D265D9|nr:CDP-glycerol glycerophosphotransferase family protein [Butyrivibrio sp. WCE2006]